MVALVLSGLVGCGGAPTVPPEGYAPAPETAAPPPSYGRSDQALLEEGLRGRPLSPADVAALSDRLLVGGNSAINDEKTMARLEILLYKAQKGEDRVNRPIILRNLGIIHYYQSKYKKARQELQDSNELNPRDPRTHFFLARLFVHQGEIYQGQGKIRISKQQFKRASIELEQARKLAPGNPLYRQDLKQILQHEPTIQE
jgi:tetratricopeptide (TPR) repeat protein